MIVNAICCESGSKIYGTPNLTGFKAGMYELIQKRFLEFEEHEKNLIIKINYDYLKTHKSELLNFK